MTTYHYSAIDAAPQILALIGSSPTPMTITDIIASANPLYTIADLNDALLLLRDIDAIDIVPGTAGRRVYVSALATTSLPAGAWSTVVAAKIDTIRYAATAARLSTNPSLLYSPATREACVKYFYAQGVLAAVGEAKDIDDHVDFDLRTAFEDGLWHMRGKLRPVAV